MSFHYKRDGSLDMRYSSSRAAVASSSYSSGNGSSAYSGGLGSTTSYSSGFGSGKSYNPSNLHYKRDGSLDMRYNSSKAAASSPMLNSGSSGSTVSRGLESRTLASPSKPDMHYKRDGTPDMRYNSSKQAAPTPSSNPNNFHFKRDGSLDMRYASSKQAASVSNNTSYPTFATAPNLHYKRDGTLDMRFTSSKVNATSQVVQQLGKMKISTLKPKYQHIPSNIPLTKVGLPDMRTKKAKEWVRKQAMGQAYGAMPEWIPKRKDGSIDTNKSVTVEYLKHSQWNAFEDQYNEDCRHSYYERKLEDDQFRSCVQEVRSQVIIVNTPEETECCLQNSQSIKQQLGYFLPSNHSLEINETNAKHITNMGEVSEEKEIGRGAFGTVYKGKWNNKVVAIKKLHLSSLTAKEKRSFQREVLILSLLSEHKNLVQLFAFSTQPPAIIMEYVQLGSLSHLLYYSEDPMIEANISDGRIKRKIAVGIVSGMIQLHKVEVIHGDVKPQNILITENYEAKITDFGLASLRGKSFGTVCSTSFTDEENVIGGTGGYMAPELLLFTTDRNYSCDVYSFGILLNELIREEEPYQDQFKNFALRGPNAATLYAKEGNRPKMAKGITDDLKSLITSCWSSDARQRPNFNEILKAVSKTEFPNACD